MPVATPLSRSLGLIHPIVQAGMSWASSNSALALAVSEAGALGVIGAGPMHADALRAAIREVKAGTDRPFAVNVPLNGKDAPARLDVVLEEGVPILIASQGGPAQHIGRFRDAGVRWLHVVASVAHARKAEDAGADAVVAAGAEAGGHPSPDEVGTLVLVRAVVKAVSVPVVAGGGIADGAGIAAALALGAQAAQLGTRFLLTPESNLHPAYKERVLRAGIADTTLVGRGRLPVRVLRNDFTARVHAAERAGAADADLAALHASRSLRQAALDGDVAEGKVEAGQSAGLVDELVPAGDLVRRLADELDEALARLACLRAGEPGAAGDAFTKPAGAS